MAHADERSARAGARAGMPIARVALANEAEPAVAHLSAAARVALVWQLTLDAWAASGQPLPVYDRASAPGGLRRLR